MQISGKSKVVYLIIFIFFLVGLGFYWLDYIGMINVDRMSRKIFNRHPASVLYSGDANLTDEQIAKLPFELYRQGYEYYWKTHAHPNIFRSVRDIVPSKRWLL